jgi:hypothetical protein
MWTNLAFVTADRYRWPMTPRRWQAKDLESRTAAVFSREDMVQALTIGRLHPERAEDTPTWAARYCFAPGRQPSPGLPAVAPASGVPTGAKDGIRRIEPTNRLRVLLAS